MNELIAKTDYFVRLSNLICNGDIVCANIVDGFAYYLKVTLDSLRLSSINSKTMQIIPFRECKDVLNALVDIIHR